MSPEPDDDIERVAGDLEDIFAGVEDDDELQKIFDSYKEEEAATAPIVDPSQRKRKAADEGGSSLTGTIVGKKRVALGGASEAEKRPLHMKKPSKMTPAQAMHDRYKKIQALKQQQLLEKKLTELIEDTASTSTSGVSTSTSRGESGSTTGKKRVAHISTSAPVEKNKAKQQVLARQQHGEAKAGGTLAVTCPKGASRTAHTPSLASVPKPFVTPDPHSKVLRGEGQEDESQGKS